MELIEEIADVKENRRKIFEQLKWRRKLFRLPIVEVIISYFFNFNNYFSQCYYFVYLLIFILFIFIGRVYRKMGNCKKNL